MVELSRAYHAGDPTTVALKTLDIAEEVASLLNRLDAAIRGLKVLRSKKRRRDRAPEELPVNDPGRFEAYLAPSLELLEAAPTVQRRTAGLLALERELKGLRSKTREFYGLWLNLVSITEAHSDSYLTYGPGGNPLDLEGLMEPVVAWLGANS